MIVQLSSGQGPSECELAVLKLYEALKKEYPDIEFLSAHEAREKGCYTSIIFTTERDLSDLEGSIQWISRRSRSSLVRISPAIILGSTKSNTVLFAYITHPGNPITGKSPP